MRSFWALGLALALLAGCIDDGDLEHVRGTTVRVAEPKSSGESSGADMRVQIFKSEEECAATVKEEDVKDCVPFVDRSTGQVRVAFQMRVGGEEWRVPLSEENVEIYHKNQRVTREGKKDFKIIPHEGRPGDQLFILLIDSSGSMAIDDEGNGRTRMDKIKAALLRNDVVDAFFPGSVNTAVVPMVFKGSGSPEPLSDKWVVYDKKEYRQVIRDKLQVGQGYTFLYQAIDYSADTLLQKEEVKQAIANKKLVPTVIALTDGFNNQAPTDKCSDNAPRLQTLLDKLERVRRGDTGDVRYRPKVYTVGLGRSAWRKFEIPDDVKVSARDLCKGFADGLIDGNVENRGVDNAALSWIARVGGGQAYVSRTTEGLASAFKNAAPMEYRWFEARYKVDPFFLRRAFETKLRLTSLMRLEATVWIHPSGWLDAPPGVPDKEGWTSPAPYRETAALVLPILGLFAALGYVPAAMFNVRRALFSRVARKRKKK